MTTTIAGTVAELHSALSDYIEATYHISDPILVKLRRELLAKQGTISQTPYLETTPRYRLGSRFEDLTGLPTSVVSLFQSLSAAPRILFNPPYKHQAESISSTVIRSRSAVVMTGTGSGKTESFLLPILGKLAQEASTNKAQFRTMRAVRAIVLYPMNALVNDQLGRLRLLFGDKRIVNQFNAWADRPVRFARYTSRTLYPGVRDTEKDSKRLKPIGDFYVKHLNIANGPPSPEQKASEQLISALVQRGKWPAKPDIGEWFGKPGDRWFDQQAQAYKRCVTLPNDAELFTRHEVLDNPPDVLVTNYSMLEYMLMRPLERGIFDATSTWLRQDHEQSLLLIVDEAHLYRGAAGAEVALLLRRLRQRLGIPAERLQVICTSASFASPAKAKSFAAQLTGKDENAFDVIEGALWERDGAAVGTEQDANVLASISLEDLYGASTEPEQFAILNSLLSYRGVQGAEIGPALFEALRAFPPMSLLVNRSMREALPLSSIHDELFPPSVVGDRSIAERATTVLIALGSRAKETPNSPGLLPCRIHSFHRGLAGLWLCLDPDCTELRPEDRGGPTGRLYFQPREACACGARVLELYTCRNCGSAYARAYTNDLQAPDFLWSEPGSDFATSQGTVEALEALDLLLEAPIAANCEPVDLDVVTGRLNPTADSGRVRQVYIPKSRITPPKSGGDGGEPEASGEFKPCGVCDETAAFNRSYVQDHQTKGDQPFQALITRQIQIQPPGPQPATRLAPLRGRKVLVFSDSRQTAARLAPNLQSFSEKDAVRTLLVWGYDKLSQDANVAATLTMEDAATAVVLASQELSVRLRPELAPGTTFSLDEEVSRGRSQGALKDPFKTVLMLGNAKGLAVPPSLMRSVLDVTTDRFYGAEQLALASLAESTQYTAQILSLPALTGYADTQEQRLALARTWIRCWADQGFWLDRMPPDWPQKVVSAHSGKFQAMRRFLGSAAMNTRFEQEWLPSLRAWFTEAIGDKFRLRGNRVKLLVGGEWSYCQSCRTTQRRFPGLQRCVQCGKDTAFPIDPDTDSVFKARKGYYRQPTRDVLSDSTKVPVSIIAAEHTAQLGTAQSTEIFSKTEEHELLFQDLVLKDSQNEGRPAIDVLSCTTTMEVGIDIGALSGVALRNMPPARSNYQQRAGRAGRRGNSVATVVAFGSSDSHDEHYFTAPDEMIRGRVTDPTLAMDNFEIARRHCTAFLLQRFYQDLLTEMPSPEKATLFSVLGTVDEFKSDTYPLNRKRFEVWLNDNSVRLVDEVRGWIPSDMSVQNADRLLTSLIPDTLAAIDEALKDA